MTAPRDPDLVEIEEELANARDSERKGGLVNLLERLHARLRFPGAPAGAAVNEDEDLRWLREQAEERAERATLATDIRVHWEDRDLADRYARLYHRLRLLPVLAEGVAQNARRWRAVREGYFVNVGRASGKCWLEASAAAHVDRAAHDFTPDSYADALAAQGVTK